MKQQIVNLKKKLLIVELPSGELAGIKGRDLYYYSKQMTEDDYPLSEPLLKDAELIGKLTDITESQFAGWVFKSRIGNYKDYTYLHKKLDDIGLFNALLEMKFKTAKESFFSALRANGIYFENPLDGTDIKLETGDLGVDDAEWQEAESKKWNINNCWLFEIL